MASATVAAIAVIVAAVAAWMVVGRLGDSLRQTIDVAATTIDAVDDTVDAAAATLQATASSLDNAAGAIRSTDAAFDATSIVLVEMADVVGGELPDSLEAIERGLPTLVRVGAVIDSTLGTLAVFGVPYDEDASLGSAFGEIERSLDGVPDRLRQQGALIDDVRENLRAVDDSVVSVGDDLEAVRATLQDAANVLDEYETTAAEARLVIATADSDLETTQLLIRVLIVIATIGALAGLVPIFVLGRERSRYARLGQVPSGTNQGA